MQYLLFGLVFLALALVASRRFATANTHLLAQRIRKATAAMLLAIGSVLALRGWTLFGIVLNGIGAFMLAQAHFGNSGGIRWPSSGRTSTNTSRLVTDFLDMELDRDTGVIRGHVRQGFFAGRDIETLRPVELAHLWSDCRFADPQSAQVLEAYLDRVHPTWRDDMARTAGDNGGPRGAPPPADGAMTRAEAFDILGLAEGASDDDIRRAHRELMMKLHPDRGGSHTLATKVNEAKDLLLGRT